MEKELRAQVTITTEFGREIPKQIGDYAQAKEIELLAQGNIEEAKKWAEGGVYRVALHTAMGALATGTAEGAFAAGAAASAAPKLNHLQAKLKQKLNEQGLESDTAEMISQSVLNLTLVGVGASAGLDTGSTAYALNTDVNNRQLHPVEFDAIQIIAEKLGIDEEELKKAVLYHIDKGWQDNINEKEVEKVTHYQSLYKQALNELNGRSIDEYLINALSKSNYDKHSLEGPYVELPPMYITISRTAHSRNFEADKTNRYLEQEGIAFQATDADFNDGRIFAAKSFGEIKDWYPSLAQDMSAFEKLQESSD